MTDNWVSLGDASQKVVSRLRDNMRFRRLSEHLYGLGPRPVGEFLSEIADTHGLHDEILEALELYSAIPAEFIHANGGDKWPDAFSVVSNGEESP